MAKTKVKVDIDFKKIEAIKDACIRETLWTQAQSVDAVAQRDKLIPIDTGTLRRSAVVTVNELPNPDEVYRKAQTQRAMQELAPKGERVRRVFLSYNTPYAARMHENLKWKPRAWRRTAMGKVVSKPAEGGPKWVERALVLAKPKFASIAERIFKKYFG